MVSVATPAGQPLSAVNLFESWSQTSAPQPTRNSSAQPRCTPSLQVLSDRDVLD
jgi:hypothetical protein